MPAVARRDPGHGLRRPAALASWREFDVRGRLDAAMARPAERGVHSVEEDPSTNPDTVRLKVRWPSDTTTAVATGTDEDSD